MPPKLRKMSNRHREMCLCINFLLMNFYQSDYNRYKRVLLYCMKNDRNKERPGSVQQSLIAAKMSLYKNESKFLQKPKDVVKIIQCQPIGKPLDPGLSNLFHLNCAYQHCKKCPKYKPSEIESIMNASDEAPPISFHTYKHIFSCSEHNAMKPPA